MRHVAQAGAEPIIAMTPAVGFAALDTEASCSIVHALELEEALEEAVAAQQFVLLLNQATSSSREPAQVLRLQYESALPHLVTSPELGSVYFSSALRSAAVSQIDEERSEAAPEPEPEPDASGIVGSAAITPVTQPMKHAWFFCFEHPSMHLPHSGASSISLMTVSAGLLLSSISCGMVHTGPIADSSAGAHFESMEHSWLAMSRSSLDWLYVARKPLEQKQPCLLTICTITCTVHNE